jgi:tetratricopeptide (TPR) repeat protein
LKKLLIICFLTLFCLTGFGTKYSLDQQVDLLYEVIPDAGSAKFKTELKSFINELREFDSQAAAKRVKKIYTLTKKKYLQNYYLYAFFPELNSDNHFNCVTGTALFAIIFDQLNIPYSIVEVPQHVYLVAYPNSHKIGIESTSEKNGVYVWTEHTKLEAVSYLVNIGKVSQQEVKLKGIDVIITEYFYTNEELDFDGIVGLQFINRSLYLSDRKKHKEALACLKRARQFYQGPSLDLIEGSTLAELIASTELDNIDMIDYLTRYYAICGEKSEKQRALNNFGFIVNDALITRRDLLFVDSSEVLVKLNLDENSQKLFQASIEKTKAIWHHNRGKYDESLAAAENSYALNPMDKSVEDLLATCIINSIGKFQFAQEQVGEEVLAYVSKYPFLHDSPRFLNFEIGLYAVLAGEYFSESDFENGEKYLQLMESLLTHPEADLDEISDFIADAYSEYSTYLYRKGKYIEALKWIDTAIGFEPDAVIHQLRKENIVAKL